MSMTTLEINKPIKPEIAAPCSPHTGIKADPANKVVSKPTNAHSGM